MSREVSSANQMTRICMWVIKHCEKQLPLKWRSFLAVQRRRAAAKTWEHLCKRLWSDLCSVAALYYFWLSLICVIFHNFILLKYIKWQGSICQLYKTNIEWLNLDCSISLGFASWNGTVLLCDNITIFPHFISSSWRFCFHISYILIRC
jgi:hypothetical protein